MELVRWQMPNVGRGQFEAVAGGVAEVETMAAAGPVDCLFYRYPMAGEMFLPGRELGVDDGEGDMAGAESTVRRKMAVGFAAGQGIEEQQHLAAAMEENMATFLTAFDNQAEHVLIKLLGPREIVHVEAGFEDG